VRGTIIPAYSDPEIYIAAVQLYPTKQPSDSNTSKQNERHSYEKCQYEEFKKRVAKMDELRAAKGGERSN